MICDGLRCLQEYKVIGKCPISLQRVAGTVHAMPPALQVTPFEDVILHLVLNQAAKDWGSGGNNLGSKSPIINPYAHVDYRSKINRKALPQAVMLYTCDGTFVSSCDTSKSYTMCYVVISAPDFGISRLFIIRFSNGLQYCDWNVILFHVICDSKLSAG